MNIRLLLSLSLLVFVVACMPQFAPRVTTELEMSQRDRLNLSIGLSGTFRQSCVKDVKRFAPNRTALFHYLSHAEALTLTNPDLRVVVFDVPDRYDREIKIVASRDDLVALYSLFKGKKITDIYPAVSAPYQEETVQPGQRYDDIFYNALRLMDRAPLKCAVPVLPQFSTQEAPDLVEKQDVYQGDDSTPSRLLTKSSAQSGSLIAPHRKKTLRDHVQAIREANELSQTQAAED